MKDSKILIIGSNGQLGLALQEKYPNARAVDSDILDITDRSSLEKFDWTGIDIIINAAAYTNVDGAETDEGRRLAWKINSEGVTNLVAVASQKDIKLVHISTDYVFDGSDKLHTELESLSPLSVYGASKAAGDLAITLLPKFLLLRTSWVIGDGKNFVRTMIGLAEKNISPQVVNDQVGRLTFTSELVRAIDHLLCQEQSGTFNITNNGDPASWAKITSEIFRLIGHDDLRVTGVSTDEYYQGKANIAKRPLNSTLSLDSIKATGFTPIDWKVSLKDYISRQKSDDQS